MALCCNFMPQHIQSILNNEGVAQTNLVRCLIYSMKVGYKVSHIYVAYGLNLMVICTEAFVSGTRVVQSRYMCIINSVS